MHPLCELEEEYFRAQQDPEFQRELVQAGVTSEYEAEIRRWIDEMEAEFQLQDPSDKLTDEFLPPTRVFNPEAELGR